MKSLKLDTRNWDNMTDMEVLYDYTKCVADHAYSKGARDAIIGITIGAVGTVVAWAAVEINKDKIERKIKDVKTKIKMKL